MFVICFICICLSRLKFWQLFSLCATGPAIRNIKAVYTTEKFGSGLLKKAVRTRNFCKETLEFLQGHRRLWPYILTHPYTHKGKPQQREFHTIYSSRELCRFFNAPRGTYEHGRYLTEPTVSSLYPRRVKSLNLCRCHYKGSPLSSDILRTLVFSFLYFIEF